MTVDIKMPYTAFRFGRKRHADPDPKLIVEGTPIWWENCFKECVDNTQKYLESLERAWADYGKEDNRS